MAVLTLEQYFTTHPNFVASGEFHVIDRKHVRYCGVPLNEECWNLLKADKLNTPLSEETLQELRRLS